MKRTIGEGHMPGRIPDAESPGDLLLVTGLTLNPYRTLREGDERYEDFVDAWRVQDEWSDDMHFAYWRIALAVWPRDDGQRNLCETLGAWIWSLRRSGLSDAQIASELGSKWESLKRKGRVAYAEFLEERAAASSVDAGDWTRAPVVVADEQEVAPVFFETWRDPRLSQFEPDDIGPLFDHRNPRPGRSEDEKIGPRVTQPSHRSEPFRLRADLSDLNPAGRAGN